MWLFDKQRNNFNLKANVFENTQETFFSFESKKKSSPPPPKENIPLVLNRKISTMVNKYLHCKHYKNELKHFKN